MITKHNPAGDDSRGADKSCDGSSTSIPPAADIPAYVVLLVTRYGMPRRRVYLDLGHARKAVERAHAQGRQAWLVLCKLEPVAADLDGEVSE
jgi:hypothetical protein